MNDKERLDKETEARKALLADQVKHAVVEHIGTEEDDYPSWDVGTYSVFVPGAVREHNLVKAENEEEAKAKVLACLETKVAALADEVVIEPDNIKQNFKAKVVLGEDK